LNDFLRPILTEGLHEISTQALAHVGDAVFELMVRSWLCVNGSSTAKNLHGRSVSYVSAKAQAAAVERLLPELDEEELAVYKRGRNAHLNSIPKSSTHEEYHCATGLEALLGFLYLSGKTERLNELFLSIMS